MKKVLVSIIICFLIDCMSLIINGNKNVFAATTNQMSLSSYMLINSNDTLVLDLTSARKIEGLVQVPVYFISDDPVQSFDFAFRLSGSNLTYHSVISRKSYLYPAANFDLLDSTLRGSAYSLQIIENNTPLLSLRFLLNTGKLRVSDLNRVEAWLNGISCSVKLIGNICQGESAILDPQEENGIGWLWSTGATTKSIEVNTPGSYSCRIYLSGGGFISSPLYKIISRPLPVVTISAGSATTICEGDSAILIAASDPENNYLWSNGATTQSTFVYEQGIYNVAVTDTNGCMAASSFLSISVLPKPDATVIANSPTTICFGDSVILSVIDHSDNIYLWSTGSTDSTIVVKESGNYSVQVTNINGCSSHSDTIMVIVNPLPVALINVSGPVSFCPGDSIILSAFFNSDYQYLWSTGETTQSITVSATGAYDVTVTDLNVCRSTSDPVSVNVGYLREDLNFDGMVDGSDYLILIGKYNLNCNGCPEDINLNGIVDGNDYLLLIGRYGASCN